MSWNIFMQFTVTLSFQISPRYVLIKSCPLHPYTNLLCFSDRSSTKFLTIPSLNRAICAFSYNVFWIKILNRFKKTEDVLMDTYGEGELYLFCSSGSLRDVSWKQIFSNPHTVSMCQCRRFSEDVLPNFLQLHDFVEFYQRENILFVVCNCVL